ncbi:MAG: glycosyltransferase family 4 protein [Fibrobacterota bacterium]|nr:glycosyltransferase family 4 protein [Fibrobacterota bacterium]QQS07393.1 MAG: glycosyltransferase family 4 protein [Fibrobacterota bacterium]
MRIFGSVDSFVESSGTLRLGRLVANATFLEALLRHGDFDRYEIFCATENERSRLRGHVQSLGDGAALLSRMDLRLQLELPKRMREAPWEAMHFGGWSRYLPSLAWLRATLSPRTFPLTGWIHSIDGPSQAGNLRRLLASPLCGADAVFCTSTAGRDAFARQLERVGRRESLAWSGRLEHVPLGVHDTYFSPPSRAQARSRLGIATSAKLALWIGRISATSKADLNPLLLQWRALSAADGNRLLILAGGSTDSELAALSGAILELGLSRSVRLMPDVDDAQKLDLLGAADVFVSPVDNLQETFGISVVEAMAAGLPVVASDWDGYKDLVEEGTTGMRIPVDWTLPPPDAMALQQILEPSLDQFLVAQGVAVDPIALRKALETLFADPERAHAMGMAGKERARRLFSWQAVVSLCTEVWSRLSRESADLPVPGRGSTDPQILDPAEVFGGYASRQPSMPSGMASLTDLAWDVLSGRIPMPATFSDLMELSDGRLLTVLVLGLRSGQTESDAHLRSCAAATGRSMAEAAWLFSWLRKYGLVEIRPRL